jgi:tetraacyldisaccharide 4'-kinase
MLPYGRLREPLMGLKRADCVVLTRCEQVDDLERVRMEIAHHAGDRPVFQARTRTRRYVSVQKTTGGSQPQEPVAAFCAIGNPQSFFVHLKREGFVPVLQKAFRDHHVYTQDEISNLITAAKGAGAQSMITTSKDAVKLQLLNFAIPCYSLEIDLEIENESELKRMVLDSAVRSAQ